MRIIVTVCTVLLGLAALLLTVFGARSASSGTGLWCGLCFALAAAGALVLGAEGEILLLAALILLCASRIKRRNGHEL